MTRKNIAKTFCENITKMFVKNIVPYEHPQSVSALTASVSWKMSLALSLNTVFVPTMAKVRLFEEANSTTTNALPFSGADKYKGSRCTGTPPLGTP